jgi:hypothetical protein
VSCVRQWYQQEIERGYLLEKARSLLDDEQSISKAGAQAQDPQEAAQARVDAAPPYLINRVKKGEPVPQVSASVGARMQRMGPWSWGKRSDEVRTAYRDETLFSENH